MGKIQQKAAEPGCLPADALREIEDYCKDLGHRPMLRELSGNLEKDSENKRRAQLKTMQAEVDKFKAASKQGGHGRLNEGKGSPDRSAERVHERHRG
jgi:hypothetical protein